MERTEKDVERYLCKRVKEMGGKAYKFVSPGNAGVPDRVITIPVQTDLVIGLTYFAEVKKPGESPRPLQKVVMQQMAHKGANVFNVATYEDVDDACEDMKKDRRDIEVAVRYAEKRGVL